MLLRSFPQRWHRAPFLVKIVTLKGGKKKLVARKGYPYISLIQSLQQLLQDPATIENVIIGKYIATVKVCILTCMTVKFGRNYL